MSGICNLGGGIEGVIGGRCWLFACVLSLYKDNNIILHKSPQYPVLWCVRFWDWNSRLILGYESHSKPNFLATASWDSRREAVTIGDLSFEDISFFSSWMVVMLQSKCRDETISEVQASAILKVSYCMLLQVLCCFKGKPILFAGRTNAGLYLQLQRAALFLLCL